MATQMITKMEMSEEHRIASLELTVKQQQITIDFLEKSFKDLVAMMSRLATI